MGLPSRPPGGPKPASFTFKEDRLAEIGRGNLRLMKNLHAIHSGAAPGIAAVAERKGGCTLCMGVGRGVGVGVAPPPHAHTHACKCTSVCQCVRGYRSLDVSGLRIVRKG